MELQGSRWDEIRGRRQWATKGSVRFRLFLLLVGASSLPDGPGRFVLVAAASLAPAETDGAPANARGEVPPNPWPDRLSCLTDLPRAPVPKARGPLWVLGPGAWWFVGAGLKAGDSLLPSMATSHAKLSIPSAGWW